MSYVVEAAKSPIMLDTIRQAEDRAYYLEHHARAKFDGNRLWSAAAWEMCAELTELNNVLCLLNLPVMALSGEAASILGHRWTGPVIRREKIDIEKIVC